MTGKSKAALAILMFNMFIAMSGIGLIIPIMPKYLGTFGAAGLVLGFLIAVFSFAQFIFSPLAGSLSDKHGRKRIIIFGLILNGAAQIAFGLSTEVWMLFVARFFSGFGSAFIVPPLMAFVADITTYEERGKGMGLLGASMSLGFMIGPGIGGFLSKVSLEFPFFTAGGAAIFAALLSIFILPNPVTAIDENKGKSENIIGQLIRSVKMPYFVILLVMFVFSFGLANYQSTISLYVDHKYGYTPVQIAILITVGGFIGVIIQTFVINRLFKRFGEMNVILVNLVIAAVSMISILLVNTFMTILLVAAVFSVATSLLRPAVNTLVSKLAGDQQGYAAGMMNAYMSLGNMVGPALAGTVFDVNITFPYFLGTFILLLCFFIAMYWTRRNKELLDQTRTT